MYFINITRVLGRSGEDPFNRKPFTEDENVIREYVSFHNGQELKRCTILRIEYPHIPEYSEDWNNFKFTELDEVNCTMNFAGWDRKWIFQHDNMTWKYGNTDIEFKAEDMNYWIEQLFAGTKGDRSCIPRYKDYLLYRKDIKVSDLELVDDD